MLPYLNVAAGDLDGDNLTANDRFKKTASNINNVQNELQECLQEQYEIFLTGSVSNTFPAVINAALSHMSSRKVRLLCTNHEYPYFIDFICQIDRLEIVKYDIHKSIDENLFACKKIDVCFLSDITHDFGFVVNVGQITQKLRELNPQIILIGDLAQSAGIIDSNYHYFDLSLISFHKWLGFPWGMGCVILNDRINHYIPNLRKAIGLKPGFQLNELQYIEQNKLELRKRLFEIPLGLPFVRENSLDAAKSLVSGSEYQRELLILDSTDFQLDTVFTTVRISEDFDGYSHYVELLKQGVAIKYFASMFDGEESFQGFRVTSKGA